MAQICILKMKGELRINNIEIEERKKETTQDKTKKKANKHTT